MRKAKKSPLFAICMVALLALVCIAVVFALRGKTPASSALTDSSAAASSETMDESETESTTEEPLTIENNIPTETTASGDTSESAASNTAVSSTAPLTTKINENTGRIIVDVNRPDWNLVVVNAGREMPEGYVPELKEILGCGKYLDYRVAPYYEQMYYAAKQDGITLTPYSAYRSYERQKNNYNNLTKSYMNDYNLNEAQAREKAATVILPPGTSEHNLGYAMDICGTESSFKDTKEYAWLQNHAHEYGFILRYTAEKQPITGIIPEPWHWRYVGVEYAEKIKNSGLCLEEYLDSIGVAY